MDNLKRCYTALGADWTFPAEADKVVTALATLLQQHRHLEPSRPTAEESEPSSKRPTIRSGSGTPCYQNAEETLLPK